MSKSSPKPEINDDAYNEYMAIEPLRPQEVSDPGHLLYDEDRNLLERMVAAQKVGLGHIITDEFTDADGNTILDATPNSMVTGALLGDSMREPGYDLLPEQKEQLLSTLKARFEANKKRHEGIEWSKVQSRLNDAAPEKLWSLNAMEITGGDPDVVDYIEETGEFEFWDFSKESPEGRRNICYDRKGQEDAESYGATPNGNAIDMAGAMGLGGILDKDQYRDKLQKLGEFDKNTFSWIDTPASKREQGLALLAYRYDTDVTVRLEGSSSHNKDTGFHGWLRV